MTRHSEPPRTQPHTADDFIHRGGSAFIAGTIMARKDTEKEKAYQAAYYAAHRRKIIASATAYRAANREKRAAQQAAYYAAHREEVAARVAAYRAANPEKMAAKNAAYRDANPEKMAAYNAAYKAANPEKFAAYDHRRRALKKSNTPPERMLTLAQWADTLFRSKGKCYWCKKKCTPTLDHVIPLSKGGWDTAENAVVACRSCNSKKHAKIVTLF